MVMISPHFSTLEATKSQVALRHGISNEMNGEQMAAARLLAVNILEPIRAHYGAFTPSSWFRNDKVNKLVGGVPNSQHRDGSAADIEIPGVTNYDLASWIRGNLKFDQLILEFYKPGHPTSGWVHCSYKAKDNRMEALTISEGRTLKGLVL